jgi:acyl dehydratase
MGWKAMLSAEKPTDLVAHVGRELGTSDWVLVDQAMINAFGEVTGDNSWFHVDLERARRDMPGGRTIAHGFLTLSLAARMSATIYQIRGSRRGVNYGMNRLRFTAPVPAGSRIRLHQTLKAAEPIEGGVRLTLDCTVEIEHEPRPAMIAEMIVLALE